MSRGDARQQMTDTDRELVDQVVEHRVATTKHLSALLDMPERTVRYRMERLRLLGMVGRSAPPVVKGKAPDHWFPTKNADSWAKGTGVPRGGERQAPGTSFLVHSAAITGLYVAMQQLGRAGWTLLAWERESGAKEHFQARDRERKIVPDAFIVLRSGDAEYRAFVEIDMGSMSMVRLAQKLAGYASYYREQAWKESHPFPPVLLVLTTSPARVESILNRFEDHLTRRGRHRDDYPTYNADRWEAVIGACEVARDPETALGEAVWSGRGGVDGLNLEDLLDPVWQRWSDEQAAAEAENERRREEEERLARDPAARRAHMQQHLYTGALERPIDVLDGEEATAMLRLIRGSGPMSPEERAAFAFIERRLPGPDDKPYIKPEPIPPSEEERAEINELVDYYIGCQRRLLAAFYARYPQSPHLLTAIRHVDEGSLLSSTDEEFVGKNIRNDLTILRRMRGRRRDYISWRDQRVTEQRVQTPAIQRLLFDRDAAALELDRRHLRLCSRCEQIAIPTEADGRYGGELTCPFCYHKAHMTLDDARRQGLVRRDDDGFWDECHRPVSAWARSQVGVTILGPALEIDVEEEP